jgi:AAA15 family ATPase/GTPase
MLHEAFYSTTMIQEIKIKNVLSFKDEVTFSFEATNDKSLENYHVIEVIPGVRLLKLCLVYGANASGKSNLIQVFEFLMDFWSSKSASKEEPIDITPFLLDNDSRHQPSEIQLVFYVDTIKYIYSLQVDEHYVLQETLVFYPNSKPATVFERTLEDNHSVIYYGDKIVISGAVKDKVEVECLSNTSFFSAYRSVNANVKEIEAVLKWMKQSFMPSIESDTVLKDYTKDLLIKGKCESAYILNYLREADFNISQIKSETIKKPVSDGFVSMVLSNKNIPQKEKYRIQKDKTIERAETVFQHEIIDKEGEKKNFELPEELESSGTLRVFGLAGVLQQAIKWNAFLAVDEIESSLHPDLVKFVVESFLKDSKGHAQVLLTTHYDGLLEERELLRNDNVWFANKKSDGATELYSLSDFTGVNRLSSLRKAYRAGKFGAVPNI